MSKKFDKKVVADGWTASAEKDWKTMNNLLKSNDYTWALFLGHLVIEKHLKALVVMRTNARTIYPQFNSPREERRPNARTNRLVR